MTAIPHFREQIFLGEFPYAKIEFSGEEKWTGDVNLTAWSPFVVGDDKNSSIPTAIFEKE